MEGSLYHDGNRQLQDRFDSRRLADRLQQVTLHDRFSDGDRELIARCSMFFLATADADGWPDVSYKGGMPGFVRVIDEQTLAFPDYDGNGMFKSLGNILVNPKVGLLFIDFERPNRMRVNGTATVSTYDPAMELFRGAQLLVRVTPRHVFPNCPRYIPRVEVLAPSDYLPAADSAPVEPKWKSFSAFSDVVPPRRR